jgi:GNAT superfamily N-acetyltransferase
MEIRGAQADDIRAVQVIFREYAEWVGDHICFQTFAREVADLPGRYEPPEGRLLIALVDDRLAGCAALRKLGPGICEMKRLYVRPAFRGAGLGRLLVEQIIAEARGAGFQFLRLDSLPRMERAMNLYRAFGFREIPRYGDNPESAICFELAL